MVKWNDIPWDENASPEVKAQEFDLQVLENQQAVADKANHSDDKDD